MPKTCIHDEIKSNIIKSGLSMTAVVNRMNAKRPQDKQTSIQNISNKLTRGTIKYSEVLEIAEIIGMNIIWEKKSL